MAAQHTPALLRVAMAIVRNPADAEDAVQEGFYQIYRERRWRRLDNPLAYLVRVVYRQSVRRLRQSSAEFELDEALCGARSTDTAPTPEECAIGRQMDRRIQALIDALPEKLRQPLALAASGDLKLVEVAAALGLPEGTVRRRIHTARARLKQALAEQLRGGNGSE